MKFWDSSAIIALLIRERFSDTIMNLFREDTRFLVWWGTEVECTSALARRERESATTNVAINDAFLRLGTLKKSWHEIQPVSAVRLTANRLLRTHPLRAADALQLAAALIAAEGAPHHLPFVCLDERLCEAALKEGFPVLPTLR